MSITYTNIYKIQKINIKIENNYMSIVHQKHFNKDFNLY